MFVFLKNYQICLLHLLNHLYTDKNINIKPLGKKHDTRSHLILVPSPIASMQQLFGAANRHS